MSNREIKAHLSEAFLRSKPSLIDTLDSCKKVSEIISALPTNVLKEEDIRRAGLKQDNLDIQSFEVLINRILRRRIKSYFAWHGLCMASFLAYLDLRAFETRDLITVLSGKNMNFPAEIIADTISIAA